MTGPEHYREAERLLRDYDEMDKPRGWSVTPIILTQAHIHATLAMAAATAYVAERDYYGDEATSRSWAQAVGS